MELKCERTDLKFASNLDLSTEYVKKAEMQESVQKEDDVRLMGELDFDAPINATIIFSDSDDDDVSSQPIKQKVVKNNETDSTQSQKDLDMPSLDEKSIKPTKFKNIISDNIQNKFSCLENERNLNIKPVKRKLSILNEESNTEFESKTDFKSEGKKKEDSNNVEKVNSPSKRQSPEKNIDTRHSTCAASAILQDLINKKHVESSETSAVKAVDKYCGQIQQNDNNTFATPLTNKNTQVFQNQNPLTESRENTLNSDPLHFYNSSTPPKDSQIPNPSSRNTNSSHYSSFLRSLLNLVSVHLALVIKAQCFYKKKGSENKQHQSYFIEQYLRYKYNLFDLSYSAALTVILPNEYDKVFLKTFIRNTTYLAHAKSISCKQDEIHSLLSELIFSVKKTKQRISSYFQEGQNALLHQMLTPKPTNNNLIQNKSQVTSLIPQNAHQEIQEQQQYPNVTMGTGSTVMENLFIEQNSMTTQRETRPAPQMVKNKNLGQGKNEPNTNKSPNQPYTMQPPPYSSAVTRNDNTHTSATRESVYHSVPVIAPNFTLNSESINNPTNMNYITSMSQTNNARQTNYRDNFYSQHVNPCPINVQNSIRGVEQPLANFETSFGTILSQSTPTGQYDLQFNQRSNSQLPLYQSKPPWTNDTSLSRNPYRDQNDIFSLQVPDETYRSSSSRDSGFHSPPTLDKNNDQLQQELQPTPLITHVTSLNPSAVNIVEGPCYMCGKITKQKCVACYTRYYCSYECQSSDWINHKAICKL